MANTVTLLRTIAIMFGLISLATTSIVTPTMTSFHAIPSLPSLMMPSLTTFYTTTSLPSAITTAALFEVSRNTIFTRPSALRTALCDDCPYAGIPGIMPERETPLTSSTLTSTPHTSTTLPLSTGDWIIGSIDPTGPWYRHHWILTATLGLLLYIARSTLLLLLLLVWRIIDLHGNLYFSTPAPTAGELVRAREARREERSFDDARLERAREMERQRAAARARMRRGRDAEYETDAPSDFDLEAAMAHIHRMAALHPNPMSTPTNRSDPATERARTLDVLEGAHGTGNSRSSTARAKNTTPMGDPDRAGDETEDEFDATGLDLHYFTLSRLDSGRAVMTDRANGRVITSNVDGTEAHMLTLGEPMQYFRLHELRQLQGRMAAAGWM
ncbi:hypothetical protein LTR86_006846 [Recurvomyces mirabilis]|nr:hypothetical protein LTR86_006846 [Recurvomyces mirabilis]